MNKPAIGTPKAKLLQANSSHAHQRPAAARARSGARTRQTAPNTGKAATKQPIIHSGQPSSRPSSSGTMSRSSAVVTSATPPQSRPTASVCSSFGRMKMAATIVASASGTLTRKIGRHSRCQMSSAMQRAAEDLPGDGGDADDRAENAERLGALLVDEIHLDDGEHLRIHQRAADALHGARGDQYVAGRRHAACRRRRGEHGKPEDEQTLAAVIVAEPAAGDEQAGIGQRVGRHHEFDLAEAGAEVGADRRDRDVDDGDVEDRHEGAHQHHAQHQPTPRCPSWSAPQCRLKLGILGSHRLPTRHSRERNPRRRRQRSAAIAQSCRLPLWLR